MDRGSRGLLVASVGATLGGAVGVLIGWAVVIGFDLLPCDQYGCSRGLEAVLVVVKGMVVGGFGGAVLGTASLLRLRHHRQVGVTVGVFSLTLLLGIAAWYGLLDILPNGVDGYVFFFYPPLAVPLIAAITRGAVVHTANEARS